MKRRTFILGGLCTLIGLSRDTSASAQNVDQKLAPWADYVTEAASRFAIPRAWIEAVILAESGARTTLNGRLITSSKGAMGLMQLMPATYADMRVAHGLGNNPYDPRDNILAGTAYLRLMFDRFGYPGLFAAYNAGPGAYSASLTGRRLPAETRKYLRQVTMAISDAPPPSTTLFVARSVGTRSSNTAQSAGLFVTLSTVQTPAN